jgi:PAS domain S-box-containing protein
VQIAEFIRDNIEALLQEWEQFAYSIQPDTGDLAKKALRDHGEQLLKDIAEDLDTPQSKDEQSEKSKGHNPKSVRISASKKHGLERFYTDFLITDVIAEYRFMRAIVVRLWSEHNPSAPLDSYDLIRFNEALDQQIFEAAGSFQIEREMQNRNFDTVLSSLSDNSYILDGDCKFIYANKPMLQTVNLQLNELLGKSYFDINCSFASQVKNTMKQVIETAEKRSGEVEYTLPSGEKRYYEYVYTPVLDDEKKVKAVAVAEHDITERVLSAEDLRISKEQLQTLNNELEQRVERRSRKLKDAQVQYLHAVKLSAIGQLSASIAHELNNPLQGVRTILKGVKRRAILEEEDKELLDLAIRENERMKNLIKNLQDFNRPSTGKRMAMDVHASLDSLLLLYKSDFKRNRISTELNYTEGFPQIEVIPDQIKQVFLNLLNNAKDACSEKGGLITISTCHDDQIVAVAIQDTGIGISPDQKDQIFKPFFTTKPEEKGMGLGLSVCKEIVENHQGEIRVESEPGKGSTFTVLLPAIGNGIIKNGNCIITLH